MEVVAVNGDSLSIPDEFKGSEKSDYSCSNDSAFNDLLGLNLDVHHFLDEGGGGVAEDGVIRPQPIVVEDMLAGSKLVLQARSALPKIGSSYA
jgi:hypothetical protein